MSDLRDTRHQQTRDVLVSTAIDLFDERGFDGVTVEEIAAAAGVSRRTAYRRFRSKDDIVLELPRRWLRVFDESLATHGDDDVVTRIESASLAVSAYIDEHARDTLVGLRALADAPSLSGASVAHDDWHTRVTDLLVADGVDHIDAALIAGSYLGGVNAMLAVWAAAPAERSMVELNHRLSERLRPVWSML